MATLADLIYQTARAINAVTEGTATGGTIGPPVTLIDTNGFTQADNYWNNASCVILYDAGGAGAAPQGQFSQVASYVQATKTLTFRPIPEAVLSAAPASGDRYAMLHKRYTLDKLIQFVNAALLDLGVIPYTDTTITIADNQTEYALPSVNANRDLRQVWEQTITTDADDNQWRALRDWRLISPAVGAAATLVLPQLTAGRKLMLVYGTFHPTLRIYSDKLSELIHPDLVTYPAALKCLMWYKAKTEETGVHFNEQINLIQSKIDEAFRRFVIKMPPRHNRVLVIGNEDLP